MTECSISLSRSGNLSLAIPNSNRSLELPPTEYGAKLLVKILRDAEQDARDKAHQKRGYLRDFPTQSVIDAWIREDALAREEAKLQNIREEYKIEPLGLDIKL